MPGSDWTSRLRRTREGGRRMKRLLMALSAVLALVLIGATFALGGGGGFGLGRRSRRQARFARRRQAVPPANHDHP